MSEYRELEKIVSLLQQRVDNINKVITTMNQQFIPKIHDRMAALERHVKKFDPMLERWENGYLVRTRVRRVEVPVAVDSGEHNDVSSQWRRVRRIDYATYQEVMRLTEEGLGIHRIGKRLGISPQTVSNTRKMPPERVEKLRQLYQGGIATVSCRLAEPLDGGILKKIIEEQKRTPDIPLSRLSALVGVSVYHLKKYLALSDAERKALLSAVTDATPVVNTASDVTVTQSRTRKSRKGDDLNDPVFFSDDSDM
ncbi:helix-turn-helix domain-containing protein [Escherichia coli]|nr:helix-turn-helix domain-containing protein [Escherichia coli]